MNFNIIIDNEFKKEFKTLQKKYQSLKQDFQEIVDNIENELILADDLGNGFKKIRVNIKSKGKGKVGGGRIITHETIIKIDESQIIFASIYNKSDFASIDITILKENLGL